MRSGTQEDTSSSYESSSDDKEELEAPEGGKEIPTDPPKRGRSVSPERETEKGRRNSSWREGLRLQPWRRTMTEDKRIVPIKKDQLKKTSQSITRLTKEDFKKPYIRRSTEDVAKMRHIERMKELAHRKFTPIWFRHLPMCLRDFKNKEVMWNGFYLALENIGLDPEEVKQRLKEGKEPWTDLEYTQECCQRAFQEYQNANAKGGTDYTTKVEGYQTK